MQTQVRVSMQGSVFRDRKSPKITSSELESVFETGISPKLLVGSMTNIFTQHRLSKMSVND